MIVKRKSSIDLIRAISIIIMIIANSVPYLLSTPHSIYLRIFCSIAAPLFIFLSGFSFYISFKNNNNYLHKISRSVYLLISAIIVDVLIWHVLPFQTFDVLYLISFGILINTLIYNFNYNLKLLIGLLFICGSFVIQNSVGYRFNNVDPIIENINWFNLNGFNFFEIKRFFVDGWFPVFPWVGIAILGHLMAEKFDYFDSFNKKKYKIGGFILILISGLTVIYFNEIPSERDGYIELFYPFTINSIILMIFLIVFLIPQLIKIEINEHSKLRLLLILGRKSLLVYIFHAIVISLIFEGYFSQMSSFLFAVVMLLFIISSIFFAVLINFMDNKNMIYFLPKFIKIIFGII